MLKIVYVIILQNGGLNLLALMNTLEIAGSIIEQ